MKSLKVNFVMNMLLTVSGVLFPLVTFPYISRILEAEGVGKISFATSIVTYFILFAQLGIPIYGVRAAAKVRNNPAKLSKTVQEIFLIGLVTSIVTYLILVSLVLNVDRLSSESTLILILSLTIIFNLVGFEWLYKALEMYKYIAIRSMVFKFLALVLMFVFVKDKEDYLIYGAITTFALSASNILNLINLRKYVNILKIQSNYEIKKHITPILTFFSLSCATTIYSNFDTVILGFIQGDEAVGYYNTSIRIKGILLSIVTSLGVVLLPRLSHYIAQGDVENFKFLINKSFHFIILSAFAVTGYFIVYAKESIRFLAGSAFDSAILPMQIILPTIILIGITNLFGMQILVPMGKERLVLFSVIVGMLVSFILNTFLIPRYSYTGAAFANLVAELAVLLVQVYFIRDILKDVLKNINYFSILLATIVSLVVSLGTIKMVENNFLILVISSIIFFVSYYLILRLFKNKLVLEIEEQILNKLRR